MAQGDALFREAGILPAAHFDVLQADVNQRTEIGQIAWSRDAFGKLRMYTYRKNVSGSSMAIASLASRLREIETNITAGSTTTATGTWNAADDHIGALFMVHDNADSAGGAPEGEASVVVSNTATVVTLETTLPMSTALAVNDDVTLISPKVIASADGDFAFVVCGVAMATLADDYFGWFQFQGVHPAVNHKNNTASTAGDPIVADAATVGPWGSDVANLWVGYELATHAADMTSTGDRAAVIMSLLPVYM